MSTFCTRFFLVCVYITISQLVSIDTTAANKAGGVEFDEVFRGKSLGLQLSPSLVVLGFGGKQSSKGNVHVGDRIIAVNGQPMKGLSSSQALDAIRSSTIPRTVRFRSTVKRDQPNLVDIPDEVTIEKKEHLQVLGGKQGVLARLPYATALFGPTKGVGVGGTGKFSVAPSKGFDWCQPYEVVFAEPRDACSALASEESLKNKVVFVHRGKCSFVTKAWQLQSADAVAMVVVNLDGSLFRMPEGDQDTDGLSLASFMLQLDALMMLEPLAMSPENSEKLRVRFINPEVCTDLNASTARILETLNSSVSVGVDGSMSGISDAAVVEDSKFLGGELTVFGKGNSRLGSEFLHFQTGSKALPPKAVTLVEASQSNACNAIEKVPPEAWLLVDRGGCSFHEKIQNAKVAGAGGVVIVNDIPGIVHGKGVLGGTIVENDDGSHLPTVMVTSSFGRSIRNKVGLPAVVQLAFKPHVVSQWNALLELENAKNWPEGAGERRAIFKSLSLQNHPDKSGGNEERFSYLRRLFEAINSGQDVSREGML
jgi:hypothetical protein